jgi:hypothetical protein
MGSQFIWSEAIVDRSGREVDIEALRQEENLLGDFLRFGEIGDETRLQELRQVIDPLFEDPRVYRHLGEPSDEQLRDWVQAAQHLGVDRLLTGDE